MRLELDDDDTTPTENAEVLAELMATADGPHGRRLGRRHDARNAPAGQRGRVEPPPRGLRRRRRHGRARRRCPRRRGRRSTASSPRSPGPTTAISATPWSTINDEVVREAVNWGFEHVGTTLLAALVGGPLVTIVHVGDSRAYRSSGEHLDLLTEDHNVRGELLAAGLDIAEYRERGVALHGLTSFIGLEHDVPRIDVLAVPMRAGDRLLLCTDGVHRQLDDDQLRRGVAARSCTDAAEQLVEQADEAGGRDNATAMVIEVGDRLSDGHRDAGDHAGNRAARPATDGSAVRRRSATPRSSRRSARQRPRRGDARRRHDGRWCRASRSARSPACRGPATCG